MQVTTSRTQMTTAFGKINAIIMLVSTRIINICLSESCICFYAAFRLRWPYDKTSEKGYAVSSQVLSFSLSLDSLANVAS